MRYALCMLVLVMGCATTESAQLAEPSAPTVHYVVIQGNEHFDDDTLIEGLATHPPEGAITSTRYLYEPATARLDADRIEAFYRQNGYFNAEVTDIDVAELEGDRVGVRFEVREGEPTRIDERVLAGLPEGFEPTPPLALALGDVEEGEILRHEDYTEAKTRLRSALLQRGYAHADVTGTVRVDRSRRAALVRLTAEPGPVVRYGDIQVVGLEDVPESTVLARVAFEPGERFSPDKMEVTKGRLYELGFFSSVSLEYPSAGAPETIPMTIRVTEGADKELRLGGGLAFDNTYFEVRGRANYLVRGFLHPLLVLSIDARPAYRILRDGVGEDAGGPGGEATLTAERLDLFRPRATGAAQVAYELNELESYTVEGPRFRLSWGTPLLGDHLRLVGAWELSRFQIRDLSPAITPDVAEDIGAVDPYRLGYFDQTAVVDFRDSLLDPHRGVYAELRLQEAGRFAGGSDRFDYVKATGELRGYVPVMRRLVLAARGRLGGVVSGSLPITERYFAGGAASHRGFGQRELTPTVTDGDDIAEIGGNALLVSSAELRLDVARVRDEWLGVTAFVDAGDVTLEFGDLDPAELFWAAGAGLRYDTLVGPVRIDVGYRLTDIEPGPGEPQEENRVVFHFSLGEAF